eukprot:CAMPEP_0184104160 /NCGR_PEP_ID=MMETSP0974-20121125/14222_1 /TAXON_ID=483370 /ORGANISM="non described non described, Strain CCMP2097" /LENGTH=191 /DNA_ID=CAMNT_0026407145 /DNA_START=105 /DNA_END=676 /DNA_ORIENTATION=+
MSFGRRGRSLLLRASSVGVGRQGLSLSYRPSGPSIERGRWPSGPLLVVSAVRAFGARWWSVGVGRQGLSLSFRRRVTRAATHAARSLVQDDDVHRLRAAPCVIARAAAAAGAVIPQCDAVPWSEATRKCDGLGGEFGPAGGFVRGDSERGHGRGCTAADLEQLRGHARRRRRDRRGSTDDFRLDSCLVQET